MPSDDELDILYNTLNPVVDNYAPNKRRLNVSAGGFFQQTKNALIDSYRADVLAGNTEFRAVVLKVLGPNDLGGVPSWLQSANVILKNKDNIVRIVAAIPHIHAALPWPKDEDDVDTLALYPAFEGNASLGVPIAGQVIRVTFQNIYNMSGPIYLGMSTGEGGTANMSTNGTNGNGSQDASQSGPSPTAATKITELGAWAGGNAINNPEKFVKLFQSSKINCIDLLVNDASKDVEKNVAFFTWKRENIIKAVKMFKEAGVKVSLSTWCTPRNDWLEGMKTFAQIATEAGADAITLDLEEPWIYPLHNKKPEEISIVSAKLMTNLRTNFKGPIAIAPIVSASQYVLGDVLKNVDIIIPQCYSTVKNAGKLAPGGLEKLAYKKYASYGKEIIMGAAAWNLEGAYRLSFLDAAKAALQGSLDVGISKVRYWRFEMLFSQNGKLLETIHQFTK